MILSALTERRLVLTAHARDDWEESKHPRAENGQFGSGGSGAGGEAMSSTSGGIAAKYDKATKSYSAEGVSAERLKSLSIPPRWTNVRVSPDPDADLQVIGHDSKGREQRRYSAAYRKSQDAIKFARVVELDKHYDALDEHTAQQVMAGNDTAAAVRLMLLTGMRPGSETNTGAEKKAHGATNLRKEHVKVDGDTVHYDFIGKEGVRIQNSVTDAALAAHISSKSEEGRLFSTSEGKALSYIKKLAGGDFKSKDLRTLKANEVAASVMAEMPRPKDEKALKAAINHVGDVVSTQLGNTRIMALKSYINPIVFKAWKEGL